MFIKEKKFESNWYWIEEPGQVPYVHWVAASSFEKPEDTLLRNATRVAKVKDVEEKEWVKIKRNDQGNKNN